MSQSWRKGYADPEGKILEVPGYGIVFASQNQAPTASAAGYAPGCIFVNTAGSIGSFVYFNSGTLTAATWTNIG